MLLSKETTVGGLVQELNRWLKGQMAARGL